MLILTHTNPFNPFPPITTPTEHEVQSALRPASQSRSDLEAFHDPQLSPVGIGQCEKFRANFKDDSQYITHVLSSPLRRSLETARLAFKDILAKHIKIVAMPELQSCECGPNSTGHSVFELKEQHGAAEEITPASVEDGEIRPQFDWQYMREDWTEGKRNRDDGL
jgi:broad specificity phosphatase PhoE